MIPFMTEDIYRNLVCSIDKDAPESIHLCDFPQADHSMIDTELEKNMDEVLNIVVLGRAARNSSNIKNRQPIGEMLVKAPHELPQFFVDIVADELNIKKVLFKDDLSSYTTYIFKPQLRTVGPKYGKSLGKIKAVLASIDGNAAMKELNDKGSLTLTEAGEGIVLTEEDLLISAEQAEGFAVESYGDVTVVLDTDLTPELLSEGFARELISKIQTMRKEAGFEVMDKIRVSYEAEETICSVFAEHIDEIKTDVLAEKIDKGGLSGYTKEWNINGQKVKLGVERLS